MMELRRVLLPLSVLLFLVPVGAARSSGRTELNLGAQAYRQPKYDEAIEHFQKAIAQDPGNAIAHLYLATAYAQQYIPSADIPANNEMAERAITQYKRVIDIDPSGPGSLNAMKGIAYLELQMKRFDEAKDWYRRATGLDPEDPESYYSIAVIDWTQTYQPRQEERAKLGMKPEESLPARDNKLCSILREKNSAKIQDGIDNLNKALQFRPDYDDAPWPI
jgi:tetratricopeptide (TPR) repeat protein